MFDFAWTEIALIAAVALIAIGPKDMPVAIRSVTSMIKKARRMASEFQTHVDEMVREANLEEVRSQINEIRNFDFRGEVERHIDPDRSLRDTFTGNPLEPTTVPAGAAADPDAAVAVQERPESELPRPEDADLVPHVEAPAFIPPGAAPPQPPPQPASAPDPEAPAFIPPEAVLQRRSAARRD